MQTTDFASFLLEHRHDDVRTLALQAKKYPGIDLPEAVVQIAGRQIAEKKLPSWAAVDDLRYPRHLSMEQCSSELTARYKASLVSGERMADLTAGFGVDCSFLARRFRKADYVERQESLCRLAAHNFPLLGLSHVQIHCCDGTDYLRQMEPVDCLFLDPARRDSHGGKTVQIADCEPDVCSLEPLLVEKGKVVMIKLSPMLDLSTALKELQHVCAIHIVAVHNECKELIILLKKSESDTQSVRKEVIIHCEQIVDNLSSQHFSYSQAEEKEAVCPLAEQLEDYLYEPGAALMKAGPFRLIGQRYGLRKLHANSHLYTSEAAVDFPGRRFRITGCSGFGKKELKTLLQGVDKANLTVRNFPASVAELRKKLKLKEGGEVYLFATTLANGEKVLIRGEKD